MATTTTGSDLRMTRPSTPGASGGGPPYPQPTTGQPPNTIWDAQAGQWIPAPGFESTNGGPSTPINPIPGYNTPPSPFQLTPPSPPSYATPPPFQAPSIADALNQPGYQFQLGQGENALQNWAAANGTLNDSSTAQNLTQFAEDAAQSDYQNVFNEDVQGYNTNYQTQFADPNTRAFQNAQLGQQSWTDAYDAWLANQQNLLGYKNSQQSLASS